MRVIDSLMDELERLLPQLRDGEGYVDVFTKEDGSATIEPQDERGRCPFLLLTRDHAWCAIHHLAQQSGRSVVATKPRACRHWPLVLEHGRPGIRITVHPDAVAIGCVAPREELPGHPSIREAFAAEIDELRRFARR